MFVHKVRYFRFTCLQNVSLLNGKGSWYKRIDIEQRLIYRTKENEILIAKCKFHYD